MSTPFDVQGDLIVIPVRLWGPSGELRAVWLDTGATETVVRLGALARVGYDLSQAPERVPVTTASGREFVPRLALNRFEALEQKRIEFSVLGLTFPPSAGIDGLLGLDFIRGQDMLVSYRTGMITLS